MRLVHLTDIHLSHIPAESIDDLARRVRAHDPDLVVVTGDIAEYPSFEARFGRFLTVLGRQVAFVLGNHDAYGASLGQAREMAHGFARLSGAHYLFGGAFVGLGPSAVLVGVDGFYDLRSGTRSSGSWIFDVRAITDLSAILAGKKSEAGVEKAIQAHADRQAKEAEEALLAAVKRAKTVVFATHVPPFWGAAWHEGRPSSRQSAPFFVATSMGKAIARVASSHPEVDFRVLCGHTHSVGRFQPAEAKNVTVYTGHSGWTEYGQPDVCGVWDIGDDGVMQ